MMAGSRGAEPGVLEGLVALLNDPERMQARLAEFKDAEAKAKEAQDKAVAAQQEQSAKIAELDKRAADIGKLSTALDQKYHDVSKKADKLLLAEDDLAKRKAEHVEQMAAARKRLDAEIAEAKRMMDARYKDSKAAEKELAEAAADLDRRASDLTDYAASLDAREAEIATKAAALEDMKFDYEAKVAALRVITG